MDSEKKMFENYKSKILENRENSSYVKFVQFIIIAKLQNNSKDDLRNAVKTLLLELYEDHKKGCKLIINNQHIY
jgi:hypothetical protein